MAAGTVTGRKPTTGVKRAPSQVTKMVAKRAERLSSEFDVETRIATTDELIAILTDYKAQLTR